MNVKRTTKRTPKPDVPYSPKSKAATLKYWKSATAHMMKRLMLLRLSLRISSDNKVLAIRRRDRELSSK